MDATEYQNFVRFIASGSKEFPAEIREDRSNKAKRDYFKVRAQKFHLKGKYIVPTSHVVMEISCQV